MSSYIILGAQWGDEGKGKVVDFLAGNMDLVVRFQGGANAGHTIVRDGVEYILHLIPSGIISGKSKNVIGNGCVIDPEQFVHEIDTMKSMGIDVTPDNLAISYQAHIVTPVHKFVDQLLSKKIGTTGRGIGPSYTDKIQRTGIRIENLLDDTFEQQYLDHATYYQKIVEKIYGVEKYLDVNGSLQWFLQLREKLKPFVTDAGEIISQAVSDGKNILYEGAQGTLLDVDHGTYPFVTSSNTTIGGAYTGGGVFIEFDRRIGIVKAYTTRVGEGPFPTEQNNPTGNRLREKGREFGATTGRPRRCGWLDLHLLKRAFILNGFNYVALTKLDCLSGLEKIQVAVDHSANDRAIYETFDGWNDEIGGITNFADLPLNCRKYIEFIEKFLNVRIGMISTGSDRKDTIFREQL